eukprot:3970809-Amphidinium_carterae.1
MPSSPRGSAGLVPAILFQSRSTKNWNHLAPAAHVHASFFPHPMFMLTNMENLSVLCDALEHCSGCHSSCTPCREVHEWQLALQGLKLGSVSKMASACERTRKQMAACSLPDKFRQCNL